MPVHPEEDPKVLREMRERELKAEQLGISREKTIRLAESDDLQDELARAWQRWRNAQAHRLDAETAAQEVGEAAADLEQALVAAAIAWLSDRWGSHKPCPYCGNPEWTVGIPIRWEGPQPVFPVTCNNCGNTALINAVLAGVIGEEDAEEL